MNVVRNLSQKTHWRIKTHLAISHLDVHKLNVNNLHDGALILFQSCMSFFVFGEKSYMSVAHVFS